MTTIVADAQAGVMVSDSKTSDGEIKWASQKIERIGTALVGCAGDCAQIEKFLQWRRSKMRGKRPQKLGDDFIALELDDEGLWMWDKQLERYPPGRHYHAIGTGKHAALAAIHLGCDPMKAVEVACEIDDGSGPPLQVFRLKDK